MHISGLSSLKFMGVLPLQAQLSKYTLHPFASVTSAVLRLECSIDCISGSVGHQQNIFRSFSHCQRLFE